MELLTGSEADKSLVENHPFRPKFYLNGFPKAGLHWVGLMVMPLATQLPAYDVVFDTSWTGTFKFNSWTTEWWELERWAYRSSLLQPGFFMHTHTGYTPEIEQFLRLLGVAHVFIYRDLRDVVVSQAHHIMSDDDERFVHPGKPFYRKLGSFEAVIKACIEGIGPFPGIFERWELYAPWLDVDWVFKIAFDDLQNEPLETARRLIMYSASRVADIFDAELTLPYDSRTKLAAMMVLCGTLKHKSSTFRKGTSGGWREHFTPAIVDLFKQCDTNGWLKRLGYVRDDSWGVE